MEDYYDTAKDFAKKGGISLLYQRPWNKDKPYTPGVVPVRSWHNVNDSVDRVRYLGE